ncbi:uncharacterized protein ARMOST_21120 [Armillaria ostoyae]|uniref:Uncharacterized protein n=1 Tax=Armillaria ostoyae TaxID=47428 RepID=A0A284S978_ARMOS|nr:uncharacterized protein ARMOST_21120 [Armillaria ostoyae]
MSGIEPGSFHLLESLGGTGEVSFANASVGLKDDSDAGILAWLFFISGPLALLVPPFSTGKTSFPSFPSVQHIIPSHA